MEEDLAEVDAYLCGPPPMVDAAIALLERRGRARVAHLLRQVHDHRGLTATREEQPCPKTRRSPERSVPKPVFTDAEAGAKEFPSSRSRSYNYFEPRKRRATVYEDVTVDVQPDPERHLTQGWVYAFANGDSGYPQEWTELKSSNWHEFLDPNEEWEQTIYRNNSNTVRQISQTLANAKAADAVRRAGTRAGSRSSSATCRRGRTSSTGSGMHVYTPAQRDAPTNMINNALAVGAVHKLRFAQDIILYNLEVSEEIEGFDGAAHKEAWQNDPIWQGTRENVEKLTGIRDWAQAFFATAVVFEPLVGELFRSGFVMQAAALQGDFVTPTSWAPARPTPRASSAARGRCSGCWPTTPSTAPPTRR